MDRSKNTTHHSEPLPGVEDGELVPPEALDVLHDQREVRRVADAQLGHEGVDDVLHRRRRVVLERLGLTVLQEHLKREKDAH